MDILIVLKGIQFIKNNSYCNCKEAQYKLSGFENK